MKRQQISFLIIPLILVGILGGAVGAMLTMILNEGVSPVVENSIDYEAFDFSSAWETASPAVVSVVALRELDQAYPSAQIGSGSAFIISPEGLILTNKHVVEDPSADYVVILNDGTELQAEVLDRDTLNDIALLMISDEDPRVGSLDYLEFADSDALRVGEPVLAIGNALGEYANTTTAGIISATGRDIIAGGGFGGVESLVGLLQTDAAINPGNSGGPLINLEGKVVGMNTAIDATASGIGFAIPSNDLQLVLESYYENGEIVRPFLGVRYSMVTPGLQERLGLEHDFGAVLIEDPQLNSPAVVEGSPAERAGLQAFDVILSVDGEEINMAYTIPNALAKHSVGDEIVLDVWRNGESFKVAVTLGEQT